VVSGSKSQSTPALWRAAKATLLRNARRTFRRVQGAAAFAFESVIQPDCIEHFGSIEYNSEQSFAGDLENCPEVEQAAMYTAEAKPEALYARRPVTANQLAVVGLESARPVSQVVGLKLLADTCV
jgi:hypothetical protein